MADADRWTARAATPRDAPAIAALVRLAFSTQSRPTAPPPGALKETAATIIDHLGLGGGAVIEEGEMLVGTVLWNEEEGGLYVGRLSVHPTIEGRASRARSWKRPNARLDDAGWTSCDSA